MKGITLPAKDFPAFFREDISRKIIEALEKGENVQLIGLPGMGASSLGMQLSCSPLLKETKIDYLNLNLVSFDEPKELVEMLRERINSNKGRLALFIDPFERITETGCHSFLTLLEGWRRERIEELNYIFTLEVEVSHGQRLELFKPITRFLLENQIYVPPLTRKESDWFSQNCAGQYQLKIEGYEEKIFKLSGGYMQTIKRLVQALSKGRSLEEIEENPETDAHLGYNLERMAQRLGGEMETLRKVMEGKDDKAEEKVVRYLKNIYVLHEDNRFVSPLLRRYLELKMGTGRKSELTASEERLVEYLEKHKGEVCSRDDVMEAVWGKEKSFEINSHTLDQLVYRVKRKMPSGRVEILRGKGIRLS